MDLSDLFDFIWFWISLGYRRPARSFAIAFGVLAGSAAGLWLVWTSLQDVNIAVMLAIYALLGLVACLATVALIGATIATIVRLIRILVAALSTR